MGRSGVVLGGICAFGVTVLPGVSVAQDGLRMVIGVENRFEVIDNEDLSVPATGTTIEDVTRLSFGLTSETALDRLELNLSGAMIIEDSDDTDGTELDFGRGVGDLAYHREVPASVFDIAAEYRTDDVDAFDDIDEDDDTGTRTDYSFSTRLETGRTSPIGFAVGLAYDSTDYQDTTDPELDDYREYRGDVAAIFHFSEVATGRIGVRYRHYEEDDEADETTDSVTTFVGLDYAISEALDLAAELGYTDLDTEEFGDTTNTTGPDVSIRLSYDMPVGTSYALLRVTTDEDEGERETFEIGREIGTPTQSISARLGVTHADEAGSDLIGGISWDRTLPDGTIGVDVERRVYYDDDEDETVAESIFSLSWTRTVNEVSSISLALAYEYSDSPSEQIDQTTLGLGYSHRLTDAWTFNSGVGYRMRNDEDGYSESPNIFVALSRDFEFMP